MTYNGCVQSRLNELADLLEEQGANPYRVQAYRRGAETIGRLPRPVNEIVEREGLDGLRALPGIGDRLAIAIRDIVHLGRLPMLDRIRGEADAVEVLQTVPGIGPVQAARLHDELGIDSLEDLEAAAHDGRLTNLAGFGHKRIAGIMDSLATRLGRVRPPAESDRVPIEELLDIDREYREQAAAGKLHTIAPRRFNPQHEPWLPILHTTRCGRQYTAMYSNTARAHKFNQTQDWVILYYDGPAGEHQATIVTCHRGPLKGRRIVRGREEDCERHYGLSTSAKLLPNIAILPAKTAGDSGLQLLK